MKKVFKMKMDNPFGCKGGHLETGEDGVACIGNFYFVPEKFPEMFENVKTTIKTTDDVDVEEFIGLYCVSTDFRVVIKKAKVAFDFSSYCFANLESCETWIADHRPIYSKYMLLSTMGGIEMAANTRREIKHRLGLW